jgi:hypothetical protein
LASSADEQVEHFVEHFLRRCVGRSILLTTTMGRRPSASALPVTNLVCGIAPSAAVDQQDDAVDHGEDALDLAAEISVARGVDDVDARQVAACSHSTEVHLARIVIPRSFSRSFESIARSSTR